MDFLGICCSLKSYTVRCVLHARDSDCTVTMKGLFSAAASSPNRSHGGVPSYSGNEVDLMSCTLAYALAQSAKKLTQSLPRSCDLIANPAADTLSLLAMPSADTEVCAWTSSRYYGGFQPLCLFLRVREAQGEDAIDAIRLKTARAK